MQRAGYTSLLLALTLLFGACEKISPHKKSQPTPAGEPITTLPWFMEGFSLLDEHTEELAIGELVTEDGCEIGSAVLIAPQVILTAGHCMEDGKVRYFRAGCVMYTIKEYRIHPKYKIEEIVFADIAVAVLETPCPFTPVPLANQDTSLFRGEELTVIGFGGNYKRKSKPMVFWYYGITVDAPTVFKMLPIKGTVYFGDSGGAVLDSCGKLVGVVSSLGINHSGVYENSAVRINLFYYWIKATALELSGVPILDPT